MSNTPTRRFHSVRCFLLGRCVTCARARAVAVVAERKRQRELAEWLREQLLEHERQRIASRRPMPRRSPNNMRHAAGRAKHSASNMHEPSNIEPVSAWLA